MIPRTFPSTYASNGQQQMVVHFLTSVAGLARWSDYIPVKLVQGGPENSYSGTVDVAVIPSLTADTQAWKEYIPVYADDSATDAWTVNNIGYIPYNYALFNDASMQLDFTNGAALDSRVTFTRATTATFTGSDGLIQTAAINAPRFDYNPTTLAPLGLLIEEQRTNLLLYSTDLSTGWSKGTLATWTLNAATAPDGTMTALQGDGVTGFSISSAGGALYRLGNTVSGSTTYTFSVYVRTQTGTATDVRLRLNETGGNNTLSASLTVTTAWTRFSLTVTTAAGATAVSTLVGTGAGTANLFIWGAQLEAGAFATSYIPTVASQVTRSADVAVMTGTNFSDWYNATEGTLYGQADWMGLSTNDYFFSLNNGTSSNIISLGVSLTPATRFIVINGGVTQASVSGPTPVANVAFKIAGAYQVNSFAAATNGTLGTVDTSGTVPTVDQASLTSSSGSTNLFNGHIRQIAYYPRRLANSELQAITA
jgi:hypothetical protein